MRWKHIINQTVRIIVQRVGRGEGSNCANFATLEHRVATGLLE